MKQVSSSSAEEFEAYARKPRDQHIGKIYRFMNQPALARKSFQAARFALEKTELLPVSKDAMDGPAYVERLVWIYVMVGEYDAALDQIEYLLSIPSWVSGPYLRIHPRWDPLRSHPRFQKLLQKYDNGDSKARS